MGRRLYVGNLPYETGEGDLQELFARAGTVETVKVVRDMATGRARGFAAAIPPQDRPREHGHRRAQSERRQSGDEERGVHRHYLSLKSPPTSTITSTGEPRRVAGAKRH